MKPSFIWRAYFDSGNTYDFDTEEEAKNMSGTDGRCEKMIVLPAAVLAKWCEEAAEDIDCCANLDEDGVAWTSKQNWLKRAAEINNTI